MDSWRPSPNMTHGNNDFLANDSDLYPLFGVTGDMFLPSPSPPGEPAPPSGQQGGQALGGEIRIPLYCLIFIVSLVGNLLVLLTLFQNKKMRTVTNVFLLNLSASDLLLTVFCMPFTLVPTLLQDFIFGKEMCVLLRYVQGVTVGVSVFTLVSISLERYFAICQPLRSRSWQTLSHSYKTIAGVWVLSFLIMVPIAVYMDHIPIRNGAHKCIERWDSRVAEQAYTLILDIMLLVLPLILMLTAYGMISWTLWNGMRLEMQNSQESQAMRYVSHNDEADTDDEHGRLNAHENGRRAVQKRRIDIRQGMRLNNTERSLQAKRRVIKMLFVVVLEFFICWTPLYVITTWYLFDPRGAQRHISPLTMNLIHLLSYASSCTNPITYCFMNQKFRNGFLMAFRCCPCVKKQYSEPASYAYSQRTAFSSVRTSGEVHSAYGLTTPYA